MTVTYPFIFDEYLDQARRLTALYSHNANPNPEDPDNQKIAWIEHIDSAILKMEMHSALCRIEARLAAWNARVVTTTAGCTLSLDLRVGSERLRNLLGEQMRSIVLHSVMAEKLNFGPPRLATPMAQMRRECLDIAEARLQDVTCSLCLLDN